MMAMSETEANKQQPNPSSLLADRIVKFFKFIPKNRIFFKKKLIFYFVPTLGTNECRIEFVYLLREREGYNEKKYEKNCILKFNRDEDDK